MTINCTIFLLFGFVLVREFKNCVLLSVFNFHVTTVTICTQVLLAS